MPAFDTPATHESLTRSNVLKLVTEQFPQLIPLGLGERFDGWDMSIFRLGDSLAVRLPRHEGSVASLEAEARWLGTLGARWTFPIPSIVHRGSPGAGYPFPWSIITWLPGEIAALVPLRADQAEPVARALAQIHLPAPEDAPFNGNQSVDLAAREDELMPAVEALRSDDGPDGQRCNVALLLQTWQAALAAQPAEEKVWSHADLHGLNVLSEGGRFNGIIDWADMAACDPAVDLGFLYSIMEAGGIPRAWDHYGALTGRTGADLHARATGVAIDTCAVFTQSPTPEVCVMGWRGLAALGLVM